MTFKSTFREIPKNEINLDYVLLPARTHGTYSYPDTLVSTQRTHLGQSWKTAQNYLREDRHHMLTIRQFVDFLNLLRSGKAYDEKGNSVSAIKLDEIYKDITELNRGQDRLEWLDAMLITQDLKGENEGDKKIRYETYMKYHIYDSSSLEREITEPLKENSLDYKVCKGIAIPENAFGAVTHIDLTEGRLLDLDDWLTNATTQGLPIKNTRVNGSLVYDFDSILDNETVAGFLTGPVNVLSTKWKLDSEYYSFGVRPARLK